MTDNMFDKFVRDKLRDHASPVPAGLWEKIEREKERKPGTGFWRGPALWTVLFLAAGLGTGYLITRDGRAGGAKNEKPVATQAVNQAPGSLRGTNNATGPDGAGQAGGIQENGMQDNITAGSINTNAKDTDITTTDKTILTRTPPAGVLPVGTGISRGNERFAGPGRAWSASGRRSNPGRINGVTPTAAQPGNGSLLANADHPTVEQQEWTRIQYFKGSTAYNRPQLQPGNGLQTSLSAVKIVGIDCPPNGRQRRNDWYLEVYGSPDFTMKSAEGGNSSFLSKKDSAETQMLSYTAGLRISKSIGENLMVKTGLQYSQINERFDLRTENERRIITVVTIRTIVTPSGIDTTISDTSSVMQIGYRLQRTYNRYRSIDIPLLLSYEFGDDNLKFALNAGAIFNLHSWYSGNTLNDSLTVVSLNAKPSGIYKQNIGVGLYAGFSIMKPLNKKLDFFLEPYFRYNLSNMARASAYTQRFNVAGLNLGLRYKLKGRQRSELK